MKKPFYKRWWFIVLVAIIIIAAIGSGEDKDESSKEEVKTVDTEETEEPTEPKEDLNITGELNVKFKENKAIVTITTNAVDGALFETSLMDEDLNMVSDFIEIQDGVGKTEFEIPEKWEAGYISTLSMMRFNLDEHPQPDHVKEVYGENGENLEGDLTVENNLGGNNIDLGMRRVPYPDEETVRKIQDELFTEAISEIIESSEGIIINIQPLYDGDWATTAVIVSDAWYYSAEHDKERFAEQVGDTVKGIIANTGKAEGARVYFYDEYQKELASPKMMGGYKIKR